MSTRVQILGPSPQHAAIAAQQREAAIARHVAALEHQIALLRAEVVALRAGTPAAEVPETPVLATSSPAPIAVAASTLPPALQSIALARQIPLAPPGYRAPSPAPARPMMRQNVIAGPMSSAPAGQTFTNRDGSKVTLLGPRIGATAPALAAPAAIPVGQEIINPDGSKVMLLGGPARPAPTPPPSPTPPAPELAEAPTPATPERELQRFDLIEID